MGRTYYTNKLINGSFLEALESSTVFNLLEIQEGLTSLAIDCSQYEMYRVSLAASSTFNLSNITTGLVYYFIITNTAASEITITIPNAADLTSKTAVSIPVSGSVAFSMIYTGTTRVWFISEELY